LYDEMVECRDRCGVVEAGVCECSGGSGVCYGMTEVLKFLKGFGEVFGGGGGGGSSMGSDLNLTPRSSQQLMHGICADVPCLIASWYLWWTV
jgi:hypothetical protein